MKLPELLPLHGLWSRLTLPPPTSRNLWLAIAAVVAWQNLWMIHTTQTQPSLVLYVLLLWFGALICLEDRLDHLRPRPSGLSLISGTLLLLACLWRSSQIASPQAVVAFLTPMEGLALVLLCVSFVRIGTFWQPLLILFSLPFYRLLTQANPLNLRLEGWISPFTAATATNLLNILGLEAVHSGRLVQTPTGGVQVLNACSGLDQLAQVLGVALIFCLAFPLRRAWHLAAVWVAALSLPILINAVRIAILAQIVSIEGSSANSNRFWFNFFHDSYGSLLFSGISMALFGAVYLWVIERELAPITPPDRR